MTKSEKVSIIEVVRGCVKGFYSERYMVNKCHEEVASDFRLRGSAAAGNLVLFRFAGVSYESVR